MTPNFKILYNYRKKDFLIKRYNLLKKTGLDFKFYK